MTGGAKTGRQIRKEPFNTIYLCCYLVTGSGWHSVSGCASVNSCSLCWRQVCFVSASRFLSDVINSSWLFESVLFETVTQWKGTAMVLTDDTIIRRTSDGRCVVFKVSQMLKSLINKSNTKTSVLFLYSHILRTSCIYLPKEPQNLAWFKGSCDRCRVC